MSSSASPGAAEIESKLLHPGPRFLLASFCDPLLEREQELSEAATWLGIDVLDLGEDAPRSAEDATGLWLLALGHCAAQLDSNVEVRELRALTRAMRRQADTADEREEHVAINDLWEEMAKELVEALGNGGKGHASSASTLRGRRWSNLRAKLANALAHLTEQVTPANLLPRDTRESQTFVPAHYAAIRDALGDESGGGLAVICAPPGSGKSELVLAYARDQARRYDHVFWLRATNRLQLEHDFLEMARILVREPGDRATLRRKAFEKLENSKRWLMIFNSVTDPAVLMPYLPWNPDGHKLCTYWADTSSEGAKAAADEAWSRYHNVELVDHELLKPLEDVDAEAFLAGELPDAAAGELTDLAKLVHRSRLATVLAAKWLADPGAESIRDYIARWNVVKDPQRWGERKDPGEVPEDERRGYRAAMLSFRGLSELDRGNVPGLAEAAGVLLGRLEPYGTGTFPEQILDDPDWRGGDGPLDDRRLVLLDALGLADRADRLPNTKYFTLNPIVRAVVKDELDDKPGVRADNLTIAARSLLHLLQTHSSDKSRQTLLELLPHAEHLATRVAPTPRCERSSEQRAPATYPVLAIEFLAHAAAIHLSLLRVRSAAVPLRQIGDIVAWQNGAPGYGDDVRAELASETPVWHAYDPTKQALPAAPEWYVFERPIRRMRELLLRMRLDGYPAVAEAVFLALDDALDRVVERDRDGYGARGAPPPGERSHVYKRDKARLYFQGALACRDRDHIDDARNAVDTALALWKELGDEQGQNSALCVEGLLERDSGNLTRARGYAEEAERKQRELARDTVPGSDEARIAEIELARILSLLGAISREQGRWKEAASETGEAALTWSGVDELPRGVPGAGGGPDGAAAARPARRPGLEINELSARSTEVLVRALLGEVATAEQDALKLWRRAQAIHPRGHRKTSVILADTGEVMRLVGEVRQARDLHLQAVEMSEHRWAPDHRITTRTRRACAASLLDAGDPATAFTYLLHIIDAPIRGTIGHTVARARAWATLGRLLIEISLTVDDDKDLAQLDLADRVLLYAQELLDRMTGPEHRHPDVAMCALGRAEVAIRHGRSDAPELALQARDLVAELVSDTGVPLLTPRARIVRARAIDVEVQRAEEKEEQMAELRLELEELEPEVASPGAVCTAADRFEIALAAIAVEWAGGSGVGIDDVARGDQLYEAARLRLEAAIKPLTKQLPGEPHQLVARSYAELTRIAHRVGSARQRGRGERDRDRANPGFSLTHEQLRALDERLRDRQELAEFEAAQERVRAGSAA